MSRFEEQKGWRKIFQYKDLDLSVSGLWLCRVYDFESFEFGISNLRRIFFVWNMSYFNFLGVNQNELVKFSFFFFFLRSSRRKLQSSGNIFEIVSSSVRL